MSNRTYIYVAEGDDSEGAVSNGNPTVWIAEAYDQHGKRVERIAHTTREGAIEDIEVYGSKGAVSDGSSERTAEVHAESADEELITNVCPLKLHGGPDGIVTNIKTDGDPA